MGAVGVHLHEEAHKLQFLHKSGQIGLHRGFAAGDDDSAELAPHSAQEIQHPPRRQGLFKALGIDQFRVVAIGTAEIAALREDDGGQLPGIVEQRELLKTANPHQSA